MSYMYGYVYVYMLYVCLYAVCMCMCYMRCVCVYVCMSVCVYVCMSVCVYVCMCVYVVCMSTPTCKALKIESMQAGRLVNAAKCQFGNSLILTDRIGQQLGIIQ